MTVNQRVKFLVDELSGGNVSAFADEIGVSHTTINTNLPGGRESKPGFETIAKINARFPEVNMDWLVNGKGEPFRQNPPVGNTNSGNRIKGSVSAIGNNSQAGSTDLQAEVEKLRMETEHLKQRLKDKEDLIEILKLQGKNTQTKPSP